MLLTCHSIRPNPVSPIARQIRSLFGHSNSMVEPEEGWFVLEPEPANGNRPRRRVSAPNADPASQRDPTHRPWLRRVRITIGVIATLAATALLTGALDSGGSHANLLAYQRAEIAALARQRNRALLAVRAAQAGEAAWHAQAIRLRSRALTYSRRSARGSKRSGVPHGRRG
jgi:hypothetical protein